MFEESEKQAKTINVQFQMYLTHSLECWEALVWHNVYGIQADNLTALRLCINLIHRRPLVEAGRL